MTRRAIKCLPHRYYVYSLNRPDGTPFYIGKGSGLRLFKHEASARCGEQSYRANVIRRILARGGTIGHTIIATTDSEDEAFALERQAIAKIGMDQLTNRRSGGPGGMDGLHHSMASRTKMRSAQIDSPRRGKKLGSDQVVAMKALWLAGATLLEVAEQYAVSFSAVSAIMRGRTWTDVGPSREELAVARRQRVRRGSRGDRNGSRTEPQSYPRGSSKPAAKLTEDAVRAIRAQRAVGVPIKALAREYGVSRSVICVVARGKTWTHVDEPSPVQRLYPENQVRGESQHNARVTEAQVREMRVLAADGLSHCELARRFGIGRSTARSIVNRTTWKHIP